MSDEKSARTDKLASYFSFHQRKLGSARRRVVSVRWVEFLCADIGTKSSTDHAHFFGTKPSQFCYLETGHLNQF